MIRARIGPVALLLLGVTMAAAARAQSPAPAPASRASAAEDAVAALVTEVRALRTELSQLASASVRSQLLVTRIQLQEQRLMHLDRQRAEVSAKLVLIEQQRTGMASQVRRFESPTGQIPEQERRETEAMAKEFKAQLQALQANEASLRAEQDAVLNAMSSEQARWSDFNNRLDELERALPKTSAR